MIIEPARLGKRTQAELQNGRTRQRVVALASRRLPLPQRDAADRFLAATAFVLGLTLLTAATNLLGLGVIPTLGNR